MGKIVSRLLSGAVSVPEGIVEVIEAIVVKPQIALVSGLKAFFTGLKD